LMYEEIREEQIDVVTAYTSDGRITAYDLVVLADPRDAFLPYDALMVLNDDVCANPDAMRALETLRDAISLDAMQEANKIVDVDRGTVGEAVAYLERTVE